MNQHTSAINSMMPRIENFNPGRGSLQPGNPGVGSPGAGSPGAGYPGAFAGVLNQFAPMSLADSSVVSSGKDIEAARTAAAQFVGMAFIQPLLAQMRETSTATGPFAPTSAEKRFGPLMDQMMSDRITKAADFPLIDSVAKQITASGTYAKSHDGTPEEKKHG